MRAAVRRYGSDGSFWTDHPDVPKLPITLWQLWNEPNSPLFWKPTPDPGDYLTLLRGFDSAVMGVDPAARIMLGGLFPTPRGGIDMTPFVSSLYRGGAKGLFDSVALHPYAATPRDALASVEQMRATLDRLGDPGARLWISEVGWASGGTALRADGRPPAPGRLPDADLPTGRAGTGAARARRRDLVLAERHARTALAGPLRAFHAGRLGEAVLGRLHRADRWVTVIELLVSPGEAKKPRSTVHM